MDVVLSLAFVPYFNKGQSIVPIDEIFTKTEVQEWKKEQEPLCSVHNPWVEINKENNIEWEPTEEDSYTGSVGEGTAGPLSAMQQVVKSAYSLAVIFLFIVHVTFFDQVVVYINKYCYDDWVVKKLGKREMVLKRSADILKRCLKSLAGVCTQDIVIVQVGLAWTD